MTLSEAGEPRLIADGLVEREKQHEAEQRWEHQHRRLRQQEPPRSCPLYGEAEVAESHALPAPREPYAVQDQHDDTGEGARKQEQLCNSEAPPIAGVRRANHVDVIVEQREPRREHR